MTARADYIAVQECDIELEAALREAYASNGPVISLIAEFREQASAPLIAALERLCSRIGARWFLEQNWAEPLEVLEKVRGEQESAQ